MDDRRHLAQHEVQGDRTVRQHHPLCRAVADVALMPQGDIFKSCNGVAANHPGESTDPFATDRIAFVGHRGTALLSFGEVLLDFEYIGALEVANFRRKPLERRCYERQGLHVIGMAVTGDHLGAGRVWR